MKKISHPGLVIKITCLDRFNLSVTDAADLLKITRPSLSLILNGGRGITPLMALRLEAVFNTDARKWLELQLEYDLVLARKKKLNLQKISKKKIKVGWPVQE